MTPASTKEMERLLLRAESLVEASGRGVLNRELGQIIERLLQILTTEKIRAETARETRGLRKGAPRKPAA